MHSLDVNRYAMTHLRGSDFKHVKLAGSRLPSCT